MPGLGTRSIDAVLWGAGGTVLRLLIQVGAQVVLARLLGPEQYGLFAIGAIVVGFSAFFSDIGLAYGLIQKRTVATTDVRFVFTWQIVLGASVSLTVYALSETLARALGDVRAAPALAALSAVCLLNALAAPSLNLLKRALDFRAIQIAQLASYAAGYLAVGLPLAFAGAQIWALVAAWLVQALVSTLLLYRAARHDLRPLPWYGEAAGQLRYALTVFGTNLVNWLVNNIDRVAVSRTFGSRDIGLYATSYNLLYNPTMVALGVVQPVFFSASARREGNTQPVARAYLALNGLLATLVLPAFACVAVAADAVIGTLYGSRWAEAAPLFRPLALAMPVLLLWGLTTPLLWTTGSPGREFRVQLPLVFVWAVACWAASRHSVLAVAWTVLALQALRMLAMVGAVCRQLEIPAAAVWRAVRGGMVLALVLALLMGGIERLGQAWPAGARLPAEAALAAAAWLLVLRLLPATLPVESAELLARLLARLPAPIARQLAFVTRNAGAR